MKYFTKYLPVEGEIEEGDFLIEINTKVPLTYIKEDMFKNDGGNELILPNWKERFKFQKQKLVLCSRDIQVGDSVFTDDPFWPQNITFTYEQVNKEMNEPDKSRTFKVIGEVSPNAIWVKEGMEFSDEDVRRKVLSFDHYEYMYESYTYPIDCKIDLCMKDKAHPDIDAGVIFKCPTCSTFH